jgi:two-component sensor histidine kinase
VALRAYFTDLCRSIGASMIRDHKQLTLDVTTDESAATADVSMSLGLIVTELVINALKHAFPDHRHGHIKVDYRSEGEFWKLSVGDDGVGMVANEGKPKSGLGTSIVSALAQQLNATITVAAANPGTEVSVVHGAPVASGQAARPEPAQKAV